MFIYTVFMMFLYPGSIDLWMILFQQWNNHPVSSENNQSPLQMWEKGVLDNVHSGYTALLPAEIDDFGVDPEGLLPDDEKDYQVNVSPPSI